MPNDGFVIASVCHELKSRLVGVKIEKVYQPERDEIILVTREGRVLLTASAMHPRIHFTKTQKPNPEKAPQFCMLLRKHIQNGRVVDVIQPGFERIVTLVVESPNEMGDITQKHLIIEIMGKHSNIILVREGIIQDAVKHVGAGMSSVREVLPGRPYTAPPDRGKKSPLTETRAGFFSALDSGKNAHSAIMDTYSGISPVVAYDIVHRAGICLDVPSNDLNGEQKESLFTVFSKLITQVKDNRYCFHIQLNNGVANDFSAVEITLKHDCERVLFGTVGEMLDEFYERKDSANRINQKSADLRRLITQNLERCIRKRELQNKAMSDIEGRDRYRLFGELITANIHSLKAGMSSASVANFYEEGSPETVIELDPTLTPAENAQRYFKRYNKEKRAHNALVEQIADTEAETAYFEQLLQTLAVCEDEADINDIRQELYEEGYIKKAAQKKKNVKKSTFLRFKSSDGFDILVGKNNKQNEELTLKTARNTDIWMHTKIIPGSHVIIKSDGAAVPDTTLNEAAQLACFYSKARGNELVAVDYTQKKNVRKPTGAKTGMVIYDNYKTAYVTADEQQVDALRV